jgi:hypothetical protein
MRSFQSSGLVHAAGIATSLINSGHQWLEIYFYLSLYQELINVNIVVTKPYYLKPLWHNFVSTNLLQIYGERLSLCKYCMT